jgi:hypothetical protein
VNSYVSQMLVEVSQEFSRSPRGRVAAPTGIWDHIIVFASVVVVLAALYLCVRFFLLPREKDRDHIKHKILSDDVPAGRGDDNGQ